MSTRRRSWEPSQKLLDLWKRRFDQIVRNNEVLRAILFPDKNKPKPMFRWDTKDIPPPGPEGQRGSGVG